MKTFSHTVAEILLTCQYEIILRVKIEFGTQKEDISQREDVLS